jgi:hypothetical protein
MDPKQYIEKAFNRSLDEMPDFLNGRLLLVQGSTNKDIFFVVNENHPALKYQTAVNLINDVEFYKHGEVTFAVCDILDVAVTKIVIKKKKEEVTFNAEMLKKLIDATTDLYAKDPQFFVDGFKKLKSETILHSKIIKKYPNKDDRKTIYNAVDFATDMIMKGKPRLEAIGQSAKYYKLPFKMVESYIQTRISGRKL